MKNILSSAGVILEVSQWEHQIVLRQSTRECLIRLRRESWMGMWSILPLMWKAHYPELSWKRDLNEDSPSLLKHEQLHWDITHLFVLKLRAAYKKYRPVKNINKEVDYIFRKFEKDRVAMQSRYDLETDHGLKPEDQQRWEIYIAEELLKVEM